MGDGVMARVTLVGWGNPTELRHASVGWHPLMENLDPSLRWGDGVMAGLTLFGWGDLQSYVMPA